MDPIATLNAALTGRYSIQRELGAGGMATVYLAHDLKHERDVALKVLRPEFAESLGRDRFLREIQLAAKLSHPHILPLYDSGDAGDALFYAMPNVEGHSLRDRLATQRQLPVEEAVRIATEVAGALDHAHRRGVIHRDIKPENIMLQDGHALVADFGIGKALDDAAVDTLTQHGMSVGTPAYMSPEQAVGDAVDARSDIYSLGCVLYEMIVGEQPFTGHTVQAVIAKRFVQTPVDVAALREGVPRPVSRAVQKALARLPIDRYDTAALFVAQLSEVEAVSAKPAAPEKSLAVLPFTNFSSDPENEFFADGVTEEILNALATIPDLRVAGRASSFSFKGKSMDLHAVGEALNVRTILEGSIRHSGQRVRITAQLSNATDGFRMWAERYDRAIDDVFVVQDEIARAIAEKLKSTLMQNPLMSAQRAPENIGAYEAYLKGRALLYRRGSSLRPGLAMMEQALRLDPEYGLAWAGIADTYSILGFFGQVSSEVARTNGGKAAAKAIRFAPDLAESHCAQAIQLLNFEWDWAGAERAFKRSMELNPVTARPACGTTCTTVAWRAVPGRKPSPDARSTSRAISARAIWQR
ncbi:MAG: serine/threonine-protein kinase [Gemmatimonadaceae bacterium]